MENEEALEITATMADFITEMNDVWPECSFSQRLGTRLMLSSQTTQAPPSPAGLFLARVMVQRYRLRMVDDPSPRPMGVVEADAAAPHGDHGAPSSTKCRRWAIRLFGSLSAAAMPAVYYITPIDPIPNHLPFVGHLDDVIVALLAVALFVRLVPAALRDRLRADLYGPSAIQVTRATVIVLGLTVLAAITATWSAFLVWSAIWLLRP